MSKKNVVVNRKFLLNFADQIYNPKTKKFTPLCDGTLEDEEPDTTTGKTLHCGLGELYVAMTGREPSYDAVDENDVCELAISRAKFKDSADPRLSKALRALKKMSLPGDLKAELTGAVEDELAVVESNARESFRSRLIDIPDVNDGVGGACTAETYKARAKAVASHLRSAAKFLA